MYDQFESKCIRCGSLMSLSTVGCPTCRMIDAQERMANAAEAANRPLPRYTSPEEARQELSASGRIFIKSLVAISALLAVALGGLPGFFFAAFAIFLFLGSS